MSSPHPFNCKTCHTVIGEGTCKYSGDVVTLVGVWSKDVRFIWEHTAKYGCASHSSAAGEAEKVLDKLQNWLNNRIDDNKGAVCIHAWNIMLEKVERMKTELRQQGEHK